MKEKYDNTQFLRYLPSEMHTFLEHVQSLTYFDAPDMSLLASLFQKCMSRKGISEADPFDWERPTSDASSAATFTTVTQASTRDTKGMPQG